MRLSRVLAFVETLFLLAISTWALAGIRCNDDDPAFAVKCNECLQRICSTPGLGSLCSEQVADVEVILGETKSTTYIGDFVRRHVWDYCRDRCIGTDDVNCRGCPSVIIEWKPDYELGPSGPPRDVCDYSCALLAHEMQHARELGWGFSPKTTVIPEGCAPATAIRRALGKGGTPVVEVSAIRTENVYRAQDPNPCCRCPRLTHDRGATCVIPEPLAIVRGVNSSLAEDLAARCPAKTPIHCANWCNETCGNGELDAGEACDPGNDTASRILGACDACGPSNSTDACKCIPLGRCYNPGEQCFTAAFDIGGNRGYCTPTVEGDNVCHTEGRSLCIQWEGSFCSSTADCCNGNPECDRRCLYNRHDCAWWEPFGEDVCSHFIWREQPPACVRPPE